MDDTKTKRNREVLAQLKEDSSEWRAYWNELSDYILPRKGKYLVNDTESPKGGRKKGQKIINNTATRATRTVAAGMHGGLTSPSRPWFMLALPDERYMEISSVKEWLHLVRTLMMDVFAKSNFYNSVHNMYKELAVFGTAAMLMEEDFKTVVRYRPFTIGEYYIATDSRQRPSILYRQFTMTARQIEKDFGLDNASDAIKVALKNNQGEDTFEIVNAIEPNPNGAGKSAKSEDKSYISTYFEYQGGQSRVLRKRGYDSIPFVAPRWDVTGSEVYGDSPSMDTLGDIKQLQKMEEKKLKALDKLVDPPMNAPNSMKKKGGTIVSGGVNYVDVTQGQQGFTPAHLVNPDIQSIAFEIDRVERRIREGLFNDMFLAIISQSKQMTATEVAKRQEEKLLMLGPVLERLQAEMLDTIVDRTFSIMANRGLIPPPPPEIEGIDIKIEYVSMLAQAQKLVGTTAIEQTAAFVGNLAAVNPDVIDKLDVDETVDQYSNMTGVPPKIIRSDDAVVQLRAQRAQQQQQQAQQQQMMQATQGAKVLSDTKMGENSALDALTGNRPPA